MKRFGLAAVAAQFAAVARPISVFAQAPALDLLSSTETDRVLVLVQLAGGNDGLNMIVPVDNDVYYQSRSRIAIAKSDARLLSTARGTSGFGMHPSLDSLRGLWDDGRMSVVHSVGYAGHSRSHFEGTDNWLTGSGSGNEHGSGWAGRYLLSGGDPNELALQYQTNPPAISLGAAGRLFDSDYGNLGIGRLASNRAVERLIKSGEVFDTSALPEADFAAPLRYLRSQANISLSYVVKFTEATSRVQNLVSYPGTGLGSDLALAARIVRGGLTPRIISVTLGGFDMHSKQGGTQGTHANHLAVLAEALRAFFDDLRQDGLDQRVVAMTFSEFGRTVTENGSQGTDHGMAAPVMLFGPALQGGFLGTAPNLVTDVEKNGLVPTTDYRSLYSTLLEKWFGAPHTEVDALLGGSYERLDLFPASSETSVEGPQRVAGVSLLAPAPNPFTDRTTLRLQLDAPQHARLSVFDAQGRHVATLLDGYQSSGETSVRFDADVLAPGVYIARLETERGAVTRPMVRVR